MSRNLDVVVTDEAPPLEGTALAEVIGRSLARPVETLNTLLEQAQAAGTGSEAWRASLRDAVEQTHRVGIRSQQLARLASNGVRQSHEKLALHAIVLDLLVQRRPAFGRQGIALQQHLEAVDVIVDPGLLLSMLEALIDWAADHGERIAIKLAMRNWPRHAVLSVRTSRAPRIEEPALLDDIAWGLATHAARALGVVLTREVSGEAMMATVEFPRTVDRLSGLTALDVDRAGPDSSRISSQTGRLAGLQVLLVTDDRRVQREVAAVCDSLKLKLELAVNPTEGVHHSERLQPELIIMDETLRSDALLEHVRRQFGERPHFHALEITDRETGFEISSWEQAGLGRISRDSIAAQLKTVLAIEFDH
ncbi:hypothetical protein JI739_23405 [Ramlibacter sp. AW1]|uniref:Uncharacterized protein n=1 Tax=Ramlibacter aurantiacus TaxID=2801330 RepID=A0A936ZTQ3_9BURK|nr:hypothetical protein [Ramlibacter aurantiacus]MBL0423303.1 hypothetical protein [Ramlibacter aurantiacus]